MPSAIERGTFEGVRNRVVAEWRAGRSAPMRELLRGVGSYLDYCEAAERWDPTHLEELEARRIARNDSIAEAVANQALALQGLELERFLLDDSAPIGARCAIARRHPELKEEATLRLLRNAVDDRIAFILVMARELTPDALRRIAHEATSEDVRGAALGLIEEQSRAEVLSRSPAHRVAS